MPKKSVSKAKAEEPATLPDATFEQDISEIEGIADSLETGRLDLADSLTRFEEGVARLKRCYATLEAAEERVELVTAWRPDGTPETAPLDDDDS